MSKIIKYYQVLHMNEKERTQNGIRISPSWVGLITFRLCLFLVKTDENITAFSSFLNKSGYFDLSKVVYQE